MPHLFILIQPFNKKLLKYFYELPTIVPGTVLHTGDTAMNKRDKDPCSHSTKGKQNQKTKKVRELNNVGSGRTVPGRVNLTAKALGTSNSFLFTCFLLNCELQDGDLMSYLVFS